MLTILKRWLGAKFFKSNGIPMKCLSFRPVVSKIEIYQTEYDLGRNCAIEWRTSFPMSLEN